MKEKAVGDKIFIISSYILLAAFAIFCLMPFILVIASSITDEAALIRNGYQLIPEKISFYAYEVLSKTKVIFNAYKITIFITVVGTAASVVFTSALAYAISVNTLKYRNAIAFFVYFTMLFSGGLVPSYILISKYLHMKDNIWVFILPALISPWNMFLLRNFFKTVPDSLAESARIDGANDILILFRIILPVSLPAIATIGLFYALAYWNEWFKALLYIEKETLYPLQYIIVRILRNINFANEVAGNITGGSAGGPLPPAYSSQMATAVATIGPIIFVYPFIQKYFVKGLMVGSVKG